MFGRLAGLGVGLVILASGFALWKPAIAARYEHVVDFARLPLGDFSPYRTVVSLLIMAAGLAVAIAAVQRESDKPRRRAPTIFMDQETAEAAPETHEGEAPPELEPAPAHPH